MRGLKTYIIWSLPSVLWCCSDKLDRSPHDGWPGETVWESASTAQAFVYGIQYDIVEDFISWERQDRWTDNMVNNGDATLNNIVRETLTSDNIPSGWWNKFGNIRSSNLVIEKVAASETIDADDKAALIAQGKFLRAMTYFVQARMFGRCVLIDRVLDPADELRLPRSQTIKETYDFILNDLQEAAPGLPVTGAAGSITRGAAYALLAEAALHGAAYLDDAGDKAEYYAISARASEALFGLGLYQLEGDYKSLFNDYETGIASPEVILGLYRLPENTTMDNRYVWMIRLVPNTGSGKTPPAVMEKWPVENFEGWFDRSPSQELVDAYLTVDADGTAADWNESAYYRGYQSNGGYVRSAIYRNRDKRFDASIVYDSCRYFSSVLTMRHGGNMYYTNNIEQDRHMTKTGYLWRKGVYESEPVISTSRTRYHVTLLRLGRSYLNYAEVKLRQGDVPTAVEYINLTRTVHGGLPPLPPGITIERAWEEFKRERRVELVQEDDRYWSLLRWGMEEGLESIPELNGIPQSIQISSDGKTFRFTDVPAVTANNTRVFTRKRYLLPIPRSELVENPALEQNEFWE